MKMWMALIANNNNNNIYLNVTYCAVQALALNSPDHILMTEIDKI